MLPELQVQTIEYPESDGQPMGETGFHITLITYLLSMLREFFRNRADVYVGANMFVYYEEGNPTKNVAPDVFVVFGASKAERRTWQIWEEGTGPAVVFELTSKGTRSEDLGTKKGLYEWLGVREYFLFDPLGEYLSPVLRGFRLTDDGYREIEASATEGALQLISEALGLFLRAEGGELHLVDRATSERLLPPPELAEALREAERRARDEAAARQAAEARAEALAAELERLRGEQDA
ncbi:MAG: Uma2 family endonuclease [Anaerolineae bacterium]